MDTIEYRKLKETEKAQIDSIIANTEKIRAETKAIEAQTRITVAKAIVLEKKNPPVIASEKPIEFQNGIPF